MTSPTSQTSQGKLPAELGFRMPPEWRPHRATWMAWPHNPDTWPHNLGNAQKEFVRLVETISKAETVCLIATTEPLDQARRSLSHVSNVEFFDIPTNDAWIRDYGPTFVVHEGQRQLAAVDWRYNAWGEKYPPFDADKLVGQRIARQLNIPVFSPGVVVEGGALEINGRGELLTTISCLLNANRNPVPGVHADSAATELPKVERFHEEFSRLLAGHVGASSITWLSGANIDGDDTDGHIDQQVRFAGEQLVLIVKGFGPEDPQQPGFDKTIEELRATYCEKGIALEGIDLPMPRPIELHGQRVPASYLNFYVCNYGVLVPQFGDIVADVRAIDIIKSVFPGHRIIGLPSLNLACGLGSFHCLTQQEPRV